MFWTIMLPERSARLEFAAFFTAAAAFLFVCGIYWWLRKIKRTQTVTEMRPIVTGCQPIQLEQQYTSVDTMPFYQQQESQQHQQQPTAYLSYQQQQAPPQFTAHTPSGSFCSPLPDEPPPSYSEAMKTPSNITKR